MIVCGTCRPITDSPPPLVAMTSVVACFKHDAPRTLMMYASAVPLRTFEIRQTATTWVWHTRQLPPFQPGGYPAPPNPAGIPGRARRGILHFHKVSAEQFQLSSKTCPVHNAQRPACTYTLLGRCRPTL
eukprot:1178685-Prorocentrum_minimum.AAC.5